MNPSQKRPLRSDIAWSNAESIGVHGYDLCSDLIGRIDFGTMAFLVVAGRLPSEGEGRMFNALLITLVEHGIVPSTLAARFTHAGAPESMQAAVAAGLLGLGSVFVGSTEDVARMLSAAHPIRSAKPVEADAAGAAGTGGAGAAIAAGVEEADAEVAALAEAIVTRHREAGRVVPGIGHPIHKPVDPRTVRLFALARETGFHGRYVRLMTAVAAAASARFGRELPVNATGAIGALVCELGLPWNVSRGLGVMARAVGLVGHVLEESRNPLAIDLWHRVDEEATSHLRGTFRRDRP